MNLFSVIRLLGGLAMFLYGIGIMEDGLKSNSGSALKKILDKVTGSVLAGVLTGTLITAVIQSSTATIVLTVALIGAGIMNLRQAVPIVLGANIGSTITAQIMRLMDVDAPGNMLLEFCKPQTLAPVALIIGIALMMFIKTNGSKTVGDIFIGFGILFSGLMNMTAAVEPLSKSAELAALLGQLSNVPLCGMISGAILAVTIQSSSAMVGMIQALSSTGAMNFSMVYPIIMGINLGSCVTAFIVCSIGSSPDAKRTGIVHIVFNIIGTVLFLIIMTILQRMNAFGSAFWNQMVTSGSIANFQTVFNLTTAIILLPFTNQLAALSRLFVKDKPIKAPCYAELCSLDDKLYLSPAVALNEATKAVGAMATIAKEHFARGCSQLLRYVPEQSGVINTDENCLNQFADSSEKFLIGLSKLIETKAQDRQLDMLMQTVPNFERIGDYAVNLQELGQRLKADATLFSDEAYKELEIMCNAVKEILTITVDAFLEDNCEKANSIEPFGEIIDDMVRTIQNRHIQRLKVGDCSVCGSLVFMEVLTNLARASHQCTSIAVLMLARRNGAILNHHHDYLRSLHESNDADYQTELHRRHEQYFTSLNQI